MMTRWTPESVEGDVTAPAPAMPLGGVLLAALVLFSPLIEGGTTHEAVAVIRFLVLAGLGWAWLMACREGHVTIPAIPVAPAIWAFMGLAMASAWVSPYRHQSVQWMFVLFTYAVLLYLLVSFCAAWEHVRRISVVIVLVGAAEAGLSLGQSWWGEALRPSGTFFNPNFLAGYLAAIAVFVTGVVTVQRIRRTTRFWLGGGCLLGFLLGGMLITGSRGAVLGVAVGATLVLVIRYRVRGAAMIGALLLCLAMLPNPLMDRQRAEHQANALSYARGQIWAGAFQLIREHPMGVGLGLYQYVYPLHPAGIDGQITRYGRTAHNAHNEYAQIGVELGVVGLLVFLWGLLLLGRETAVILRMRFRRIHRGVIVGAAGAVTTLLVHAAVDANLHEPALAILLACFAAVLLSARRWAGGMKVTHAAWTLPMPGAVTTVGAAGAGLVLLLAICVAGMGAAWSAQESGNGAASRQDYSRAVHEYERAVSWDPTAALYHSSLGAAHYHLFMKTGRSADFDASVAELRTAMALNPLDGRLAALLGSVYAARVGTERGRAAEPGEVLRDSPERKGWRLAALSAYETAIAREPYSPFYRFELARLRHLGQDAEGSESALRSLIEIEPNFLPGRALLILVLNAQGRMQDAQDEYREIVDRQQRFSHWTKDLLEQRYLDVDATRLAGEMNREVARL